MLAALLVVIAIALHVWIAYKGYKFGAKHGHKWLGLAGGVVLFLLIIGPIFWAIVSKLTAKASAGVGAA